MATVIFFHAHPDDEALSTGGTMALLAESGHRVVLVVATRGEEGEPVEGILVDGESLGSRRTAEVATSARILGVERVEFLGYRDSGMAGEETNANPDCFWQADVNDASRRLASLLADESVDLAVFYDPNGGYGHPDHIQVHRVGTQWALLAQSSRTRWVTLNRDVIRDGCEDARDAGDFDEVATLSLEERRERAAQDSFGMPESQITHAIDVRPVVDRKRAAVAAHASQIADDSFFLAMSPMRFAAAFGTEWFVDPKAPRSGEPFRTDPLLF